MPPASKIEFKIPYSYIDNENGIDFQILEYQSLDPTGPQTNELYSIFYALACVFKGTEDFPINRDYDFEFHYYNLYVHISKPLGILGLY